jgi:hypothetical protein
MPTYDDMMGRWEARGGERKKHEDADYYNQNHAPILRLDTARSPIDWLHAVLGIVRMFEEIHAQFRGKLGKEEEIELDRLRYQQHLHDKLHINRSILGLTGNECVKILRNSTAYVSMVSAYRKAPQFITVIDQFCWLHEHVSGCQTTAAEWRDRAREFGMNMRRWFGAWVGGSIYLHAVVNHAWRWMESIEPLVAVGALGDDDGGRGRDKICGGLLPFTTQGMEAVNKKLKHDKKLLSACQPLRSKNKDEVRVAILTQLQQVVRRHNGEASELTRLNQPSLITQQHICSLCFVPGHNRRTCFLKPVSHPPPPQPALAVGGL